MQKLTIVLLVSVLVLLCIAASADATRPWSAWGGVGRPRGGNRGRGPASSSSSSSSSSDSSGRGRGRGKGRGGKGRGGKGRGKGGSWKLAKRILGKGGRRKCGPNAHWVKTACICNTGCHGNPYKGCKLAGKGY